MRLLATLLGLALIGLLQAAPPINSTGCNEDCTCTAACNVCQIGNVTVLCLQGTHYDMGRNYGNVLKPQLLDILSILKNYYITQKGYTYKYLVDLTTLWHYRYSYNYQSFIEGIADATNLTMAVSSRHVLFLEDTKMLNGMVIYGLLDDWNACPGAPPGYPGSYPAGNGGMLGGCAFSYIPPHRSATGKGFATRNYDFPEPFYLISQYIVTTILVENDKAPTAFISMPGQVYCQNCINSHEVFMELNNGGPSGGFCVHPYRRGLLIDMLLYMQNSGAFWQLDNQLRATEADIALIVGVADANQAKAYEFSPYLGSRTLQAFPGEPLVTTNFFQNASWERTLPVNDATTWNGFRRRDNIERLIHALPVHNLATIKDLWAKRIEVGGAVWDDTVYQLVYDTSTGSLHIHSVKHGGQWVQIPLRSIFATAPKSIDEPRPIYWGAQEL